MIIWHKRKITEKELSKLASLLKELYRIAQSYGADNTSIRQIENLLAIIYEEENPVRNQELYQALKGLYFPKAGLSEFCVLPAQSANWRAINQRLSMITQEIAHYEQALEYYRKK